MPKVFSQPPGAISFENVQMAFWLGQRGCVDTEGAFHLVDDPRQAERIGRTFSGSYIEDKLYAVFGEPRLSVEQRAWIASHRPDWVHAVIYAEESRSPEPGEALIDAAIDSSDSARLESCAFAAACSVLAGSRLDFDVDHFVVRFAGRNPMDVVVEVNMEDATRYGYVLEFEP